MKEIRLSPEQKVDLEALHDASRDKRVCDRIKAVLLCSEGWSTKKYIDINCISVITKGNWRTNYQATLS